MVRCDVVMRIRKIRSERICVNVDVDESTKMMQQLMANIFSNFVRLRDR